MWIASKHGFFSIVDKADGFHVRARVRRNLENLKKFAGLRSSHAISESRMADYRFRMIVGPEALVSIFTAFQASIDYPNFKNEIASRPDQRSRLDSYHKIWAEMAAHQDK
jgi:hypothetical protein